MILDFRRRPDLFFRNGLTQSRDCYRCIGDWRLPDDSMFNNIHAHFPTCKVWNCQRWDNRRTNYFSDITSRRAFRGLRPRRNERDFRTVQNELKNERH